MRDTRNTSTTTSTTTSTSTSFTSTTSSTSSSTTTTSSSSTSTTSTTTLVEIYLESAEVIWNFSTVRLTFNEPARLSHVGIPADIGIGYNFTETAPCVDVFTGEMMAALGNPETCLWSEDHLQMDVPLGYTATLLLGENITVEPGRLVPAGNTAWNPIPQMGSPLWTQQSLEMVSTGLDSSAVLARACSWLYFTCTNLTGHAGRPFRVRWSFGAQTPEPMRQSLQEVLDNATSQDLQVVTVSPAQYKAAVEAVAQQLGEVDIIRLEVVASVYNWLGEETMDTASAWVQLDQAPQVVPAGPTALTIFNREEAEFVLETVLREDAVCSDADRYNRRISVDWEYSNATHNWTSLSTA
ncbi:unnamed protein product, partial [Effrenium voratum]